MATYVSNCAGDENGGAYGGAAGDQTGYEYYVRAWYNFGYTMVFRHPDAKVRALIAQLAKEAANNNNIGYDQSQRLTFRNQLRAVGYYPSRITTKCESDCSASTGAIIEAVGALLGNGKLYDFDTTLSTHYMAQPLVSAGFEKLTDSKYLTSGDYLMAGDICLKPASHVNIVITDGSKASGETSEPVFITTTKAFSFTFKQRTKVRTTPEVRSDNLLDATWAKGDTATFDGIAFGSGYVWGTYIGPTTKRRLFSAIGTHELGTVGL